MWTGELLNKREYTDVKKNSRIKLSEWKLSKLFQVLKQNQHSKQNLFLVHNTWTRWTHSRLQWTKVSIFSSAYSCSSLAAIFYHSRRMCLFMENETRASASAAYTSDPFFFVSRLQVFFPALEDFPFRIFQCLLIMNNCSY